MLQIDGKRRRSRTMSVFIGLLGCIPLIFCSCSSSPTKLKPLPGWSPIAGTVLSVSGQGSDTIQLVSHGVGTVYIGCRGAGGMQLVAASFHGGTSACTLGPVSLGFISLSGHKVHVRTRSSTAWRLVVAERST